MSFHVDLLALLIAIYSILVLEGTGEAALISNSTGGVCPGNSVSLTCTLPVNVTGTTVTTVRWRVLGMTPSVNEMEPSTILSLPQGMLEAVYVGVANGMVTSTLTSITDVSLLNETAIECDSSGEMAGPITIIIAVPPSPPLSPRVSSVTNQTNVSLVTLQWDPPSDSGGVAVSYELTVSPAPLSGPPPSLTNTSIQLSLDYNTAYNVSLTASNCAGSSEPTLFTFSTSVTCDQSPSSSPGLTIVSIPLPALVDSLLVFICTGSSEMVESNCGSDGMWNPDPENYACPTSAPPVTCPPPGAPANGSVNTTGGSSYSEGSVVSYSCDPGLFPMGLLTATCTNVGGDGVWRSVDPGTVVCRISPANCTVPVPPSNGSIVDYESLDSTVVEGTVLTYQCDSGLVLNGTTGNITCGNDLHWSQDPLGIMCVENNTATPAGTLIAAIAGGVAGALIAILLFIIVLLVIIFSIFKTKSKREESGTLVEMSGLQGDYSELRHNGPRGGSTRRVPSPVVDEEGYNRITHDIEAPPTSAYSEVTLDSEIKLDLGADGYSKVSGEAQQRLPGYSELHSVAAASNKVESVVYADLGSVVKSSRSKKPAAPLSTVDQHQVTYASVDMVATKKLKDRAATMPAKAPKDSPDLLLNLDQVLIQLQPVHARWFEFGSALGIPETLLEQIQESKYDKTTAMTEIMDSWIRGCGGQPTWRELADALKKINEKHLAQQLMSIYETGKLPVEVNLHSVPTDMYKYTREAPPPIPSRSPAATDSPGLSRTLPTSPTQSHTLPARPPKANGQERTPARPPKPRDEPPVPARPPKPPRDQP